MIFNNINNDNMMFVYRYQQVPDDTEYQIHAHSCFELIYLISGDITFYIEGRIYHPKPRDIMIFNKLDMHKTVINSKVPYERIVIRIKKDFFSEFDPEHRLFSVFNTSEPSKVNLIRPSDFSDDYWETCLKKIITEKNNSSLHIAAYLIPFLNEIRKILENSEKLIRSKKELPEQIIEYINFHLSTDLTPERIAESFYISRSKLDKLFRKNTGSSVVEYITAKRLVMARGLLLDGKKPTDVYLRCGFKEYSTFYRTYKQKFGVSPKQDAKKPTEK